MYWDVLCDINTGEVIENDQDSFFSMFANALSSNSNFDSMFMSNVCDTFYPTQFLGGQRS